jgi:hypothetical protein
MAPILALDHRSPQAGIAPARGCFYIVAMTTPEQPAARWTKDRAGATAAAGGVGYLGLVVCHEQIRSFHYAYTASMVFGLVAAHLAYLGMMRIMRRLP